MRPRCAISRNLCVFDWFDWWLERLDGQPIREWFSVACGDPVTAGAGRTAWAAAGAASVISIAPSQTQTATDLVDEAAAGGANGPESGEDSDQADECPKPYNSHGQPLM